MEDNPSSSVLDGQVVGIRFGMATRQEICTASISNSSISHASQLSNPFLGLPLEYGRCESCGTSEAGKCEGHFGYIELPVPIYHPNHVSELKRILNLVCLNCLKMKKIKFPSSSSGLAQRLLSPCCQDANAALVSIREVKTADGACYLALKVSKSKMHDGFWSFLEKYGYRYEGDHTRALLACEVMEMIKRFPPETKKKLAGKGYFPQDGYVMKYLPVPPNCLSVPVVSDGVSVMSSDPSMTFLRKLLRKVEVIRSSRSGEPNFESHQVEANDLQSVVDQYLQIRGCAKPARDIETHFGVNKELSDASNKAWLDKMKSLFISKGSGFSSRSVITGDGYKRINEVGIPLEIAQRITFEERVNAHNMCYLQKLVDENLCLAYREGLSTYSLREGSKGHTYLKPGQIVHRRIMDGDIVFINRPPTTHKHSLQALAVYIHDDHTVKINPLICGPLGADFDGDCVHLFYPQSLAAKAEVVELFSVEKQLLSSHSGNLNLQLSSDSLLSLKMLVKKSFWDKAAANQLAMFLSLPLPRPALLKACSTASYWTSMQILQCALPLSFDCTGGRYWIRQSDILEFDLNRDVLPAVVNEIAASIFFGKGPQEALRFFDVLQPFLMENIFSNGFSVGLQDFSLSRAVKRIIDRSIGKLSPLLYQLRCIYNELVAQQLEKHMQDIELPAVNFASKSTRLGDLIDPKSKSALDKVVQQIGFLGQQLFVRGRLYSKGLLEDVASHFQLKCYYDGDGYPSAEYGLLRGCFFHGLDPFEELVHSISTREIMVRSSRGLSEPGTLFKNLMAILRDVVVCYDGTVRNVCSNSIIQFEYGVKAGDAARYLFPAGEPVGVLAATSMSNPAYKAVLDASPSSNCSWELMKEILLCKVNFRNEPIDRRVILYLNDCDCGRSYCRENAAYIVKNQLRKVSLKDTAVDFIVEYQQQRKREKRETDAGLVGHIHLDEVMLEEMKINMAEVFQRCQEKLHSFSRKRKFNRIKRTELFFSESCASPNFSSPCLTFVWPEVDGVGLDEITEMLSDTICPVLLDTIIQGDPRISSTNITWVNPDSNTWVRNPSKSSNGELALDIILEKAAVKQSGDAWRIVLDSCLPVLHLIDTRRSIPYAIKQIQELLGISCTFDQGIQRLAASVKMVAKGVLREHLILLASSMTCGGNLVGFNTGGYKALARQLNIQVPFTDATLFTPKRCFERAAEKGHTDSLSSVVASCSWGKPVAVGTGSRFDVLWDAKEQIKSNEIEGMDVYNFLHMVKSLTNGEEENNACLGEDIDDLLEEENADCGMSPQHASGFDAVFEETFEVLNGSESNGWDATTDRTETKSTQWSAWDNNKVEPKDGGPEIVHKDSWTSPDVIKDNSPPMTNAWDGNMDQTKTNSNNLSAWGRNKSELQDNVAERAQGECGSSAKWTADVIQEGSSKSSAWKSNTEQPNDWSGLERKKSVGQDGGTERAQEDSWRQEDPSRSNPWDSNTDQTKTNSSGWESWGKNKPEVHDDGPKRSQDDSWSSQKLRAECNVGADIIQDSSKPSSWGAKSKLNDSSNWGGNKDTTKPKSNDWSNWGQKRDETPNGGSKRAQDDSWISQKDVTQENSSKADAWGANNDDTSKPKSDNWSTWGKNKDGKQDGSSERAQEDSLSFGKWIPEPKVGADTMHEDSSKADAWDANNDTSKPKSNNWSTWGKNKDGKQDGGSERAQEDSFSFGNWKPEPKVGADTMQEDSSRSNAWDSQIASANSDGEKQFQWGKGKQGRDSFNKNRFEGSQGWGSNAGDMKNKNRPPGRAPGPRLDLYSSEEQDILKDIEPIVQSIRRIMQQEGYNDGDPLAADDQQFILENVFEHHPDKETKMGAGIDYVMVSRHTNFQESRCLYVVLKDGQKEDFSYRKCLDSMIRKKYPEEVADSFIGKYFRKPRPRDQTPNPTRDQTPNPTQDQTPIAATGDQPQTPAPVEETNE